jgi:hypothetical protein
MLGLSIVLTCVLGAWVHLKLYAISGTLALDVPLVALFTVAWLFGITWWGRGVGWFFRRERLWLYVWTVAGVVTVIVLGYVEEAGRGRRDWAAVQHEWSVSGERFDLSAILPSPLRAEDNFAMTPVLAALFDYKELPCGPGGQKQYSNPEAVKRLTAIQLPKNRDLYEGWIQARPTDLRAWQLYFRTNGMITASDGGDPADDILKVLSRYDSVFDEMRSASSRPSARYQCQYEKGWSVERPHLAVLSNLAHLLNLKSVAELSEAKTTEAFADVKLIVRLADSLKGEPGASPLVTRDVMLADLMQPIWEGLALHLWTDAQLSSFQDAFHGTDLLAEHLVAIRGETILWVDFLNQTPPNKTSEDIAPGNPLEHIKVVRNIYPSGWLLAQRAGLYRFYKDFLTASVNADEQRVFVDKIHASDRQLSRTYVPMDQFFRTFITPKLKQVFDESALEIAFTQTAVNEAFLACALERYHLKHGRFPETLDAIPVDLLGLPADGNPPHDLITGQPLHYGPTADGFLIYSVGWNQTDDGGKPPPFDKDWRGNPVVNLSKQDWVWRTR